MKETRFFCKKIPSRTYMIKKEAHASCFKAQNDRITLLKYGNGAGFMLKPGLTTSSHVSVYVTISFTIIPKHTFENCVKIDSNCMKNV